MSKMTSTMGRDCVAFLTGESERITVWPKRFRKGAPERYVAELAPAKREGGAQSAGPWSDASRA